MLLVLSSGCWNSREITDLSIASAVGFDKGEKGEFKITVQIINASGIIEQKSDGRSAMFIFTTTGKTMFEAMRKLTQKLPRKVYFSHIQVVVFGESLAKEGIKDTIDFMSRDHEFRSDFFMLIARDNTAKEVISSLVPLNRFSAIGIAQRLQNSEKSWAPSVTVRLNELLSNMVIEGKDPIMTAIKIIPNGGEPLKKKDILNPNLPSNLKVGGIAAIKNDKLIGYFNEDESKGINYINNKVKNTVGSDTCPGKDGFWAVEIINSKSNVKTDLKDGKPNVNITLNVEALVGEVDCSIDLTKEKTIKKLEKIVSEKAIHLMKDAVKKSKEYSTDVFGFGNLFHQHHPDYWKENKDKWNEIFKNIEVTYKAECNLRRTGTITNPIYGDIK
jgi:spore germination protein KC